MERLWDECTIVAFFWIELEIHHNVLYVVCYVEHQHKWKDHKSRMKKAHACLLAHCGFPSLGIQCCFSVNAFSISLISLLYGIRKIFQAANHYHNRFIHLLLLFCTNGLSWMLWGKRYSSGSLPIPTVSVFLPACCFAIPAILCSLFLFKWQRLSDREETFCYCKTGRLLYKRTDFFTCTLITRKAQSINGTNNSFCFACRNWKVSDAELWMLCPFFFFLSIYFLSFYVTVWVRSAIKSWAESAEMKFAPGISCGLTGRRISRGQQTECTFCPSILLNTTSAKWQWLWQ